MLLGIFCHWDTACTTWRRIIACESNNCLKFCQELPWNIAGCLSGTIMPLVCTDGFLRSHHVARWCFCWCNVVSCCSQKLKEGYDRIYYSCQHKEHWTLCFDRILAHKALFLQTKHKWDCPVCMVSIALSEGSGKMGVLRKIREQPLFLYWKSPVCSSRWNLRILIQTGLSLQ